jgi:hypothetical protein
MIYPKITATAGKRAPDMIAAMNEIRNIIFSLNVMYL